jgi:hypothetical protein
MKISDELAEIKRRYKKITDYKFAYNETADLKKTGEKILCYYLLHHSDQGYWIFKFIWYDKKKFIKNWRTFLEGDGEKQARWILQNKILQDSKWSEKRASVNGIYWKYKDLVCWTWPKKVDDYRRKDKKYHG